MSETIADTTEGRQSIFQSSLPLEAKLEQARTELLDLSARNRLLNMPRSAKSAKVLEVVDERSSEVFRLLVRDQKVFTFLPGKADPRAAPTETDAEEIAELAQPEDESVDERGVANRHADTRLQTRLTPAGLQKRLLDLYYDARTLEEEQGVNILFLALGSLKWIDPNNAANTRHAPLVLVPVSLERGNAGEKFKLRWRQEDPAANLSLESYLDRIHHLKLPVFEGGEEFDLSAYTAAVAQAVEAKPGWEVKPDDIVLGFFSFAKFLMYRDLDPETWPQKARLSDHLLVRQLVSEGFPEEEALLPEEADVDAHISPAEMVHIVDSDSSQTRAIHEVRQGRNLVIQGPPGTGKSQTIANIIASAVADGKTVLFVAEKMAALEVVKRRLDNTGVGDACLELHSNKANKRAVLEDLRRTWELGAPRGDAPEPLLARLTEARDQLNGHAERLHRPLGAAGYSPFQVIGHLTRLKQQGQAPTDVRLDGATSWSADDFRRRTELLLDLAERVVDIGVPAQHLWRGVDPPSALPTDVDRLDHRIEGLISGFQQLGALTAEDAQLLTTAPPRTLPEIDQLAALAARVATAPDLESVALGSSQWAAAAAEIEALISDGERHEALQSELATVFSDAAWETDVEELQSVFRQLPDNFPIDAYSRAGVVSQGVPGLADATRRLAAALGREADSDALAAVGDLALIGERVAHAPAADPQAFAADLWDAGVEHAGDLAGAVATLEAARSEIGSNLSDSAWSADLSQARQTLAAHGSSLLRMFNSDWRRANRLVQSFLADPKTPLARRLMLLDALSRGQAALAKIRQEEDFGRSAFGHDWRGERSASAPLVALVEWMRSLRGLGAEPRLIASRRPDRALIDGLVQEVTRRKDAIAPALSGLWSDLGDSSHPVFSGAAAWDQCQASQAAIECGKLHEANETFARLAPRGDEDTAARCHKLDLLIEGQSTARRLLDGNELGRSVFGGFWQGPRSSWRRLREISGWVAANGDIREVAASIADRGALASRLEAACSDRTTLVDGLRSLLNDLRADQTAVISPERIEASEISRLIDSLTAWHHHAEQLSKWVAYRKRASDADGQGLSELVSRMHQGALAPEAALPCFEMSYFEAVFTDQVRQAPELLQFDGDIHSRTVRNFMDLDRQRIQHAAIEVVKSHHRRIPPSTGGAVGPLGTLKAEIARKRGHMPIRQLMARAAPAVQALKPVFMMSPLSVAQFLPPGALRFDLLVMDEASQIQPVDALGAIARCGQVVVVGDPQQLPPTAFFAKMTSAADSSDDEEGGAGVADIESILGLFTARGLPLRMLRWHYRSRHQSLIAVSNRQFYENKLVIVPSPYTAQSGLGLRFHHIADGIFETGTTRTNPVEAKAVARAIVEHALTTPERSLGVVAFSAAQRRAIQDQLEILRRQLPPEHEAFFQSHPAEPFFIKNLENVQGDERDVIFISVGYGPTALGAKPPMRFGPLGQEGGERRLNVLISRAKRRCEVFASMTDEDIDPDFASTRKGVFAFKLFMHFARTGQMSLAETQGTDQDEVFEAQVAQALQARGYQVHRKVGVSGLFVDLAIADPDQPDRYILGVDCDGPAYRAARSARDRDRLRKTVLEDHGWIIQRVWSTDWFRRPKEQLERLVTAIEAAKTELTSASAAEKPARPFTYEVVSVEREDVTEMGLMAAAEHSPAPTAYEEAVLAKPSHLFCDIHEAPTGILTSLAEEVVRLEGPVHLDEITSRIRDAWGAKRAGGRIQDAVARAIAVAARQQRVKRDGNFYSLPGSSAVVRDRSAARSPSLRKPEMLPPSEIAVALIDVVGSNFGATEDQSVLAVSRAFGFKATSAQLRDTIADVLNDLVRKEVLIRRDTLIDLGPNAPAAQPRRDAPTPIEKLIAEGEHERLEFKQSLRWDIRQQNVNKKLEDVVIKTIAALANHRGGTLLIGVSDDGTVTGLDGDLQCTGGSRDRFELHLSNLVNSRFSEAFRAAKVQVTFPTVGEQMICRLDVQRSREPMYVTLPDQSGAMAERLFVRSGNASQEIPPSQIVRFVKEHFEAV